MKNSFKTSIAVLISVSCFGEAFASPADFANAAKTPIVFCQEQVKKTMGISDQSETGNTLFDDWYMSELYGCMEEVKKLREIETDILSLGAEKNNSRSNTAQSGSVVTGVLGNPLGNKGFPAGDLFASAEAFDIEDNANTLPNTGDISGGSNSLGQGELEESFEIIEVIPAHSPKPAQVSESNDGDVSDHKDSVVRALQESINAVAISGVSAQLTVQQHNIYSAAYVGYSGDGNSPNRATLLTKTGGQIEVVQGLVVSGWRVSKIEKGYISLSLVSNPDFIHNITFSIGLAS